MQPEKPSNRTQRWYLALYSALYFAYLLLGMFVLKKLFVLFSILIYIIGLSTTIGLGSVNKKFGVQFHDTPRSGLLKTAHFFLIPAIFAYLLFAALFTATQSPIVELLANIVLLIMGILLALFAAIAI